MKKLLGLSLFTFTFSLFTFGQVGTWTALANQAPDYNKGVMLLLTDGTVICANSSGAGYGTGWDKLTPDIHGSYANGTWTRIASMNYDRTAFASQVLPSGKVWVAGGEYGAGGNEGEVCMIRWQTPGPYVVTFLQIGIFMTAIPNSFIQVMYL